MEMSQIHTYDRGNNQPTASEQFLCSICDRPFPKKSTLYRHIRSVHKVRVKMIRGKIKCPLCKADEMNYETLRTHLNTVHSCTIENESHVFNSVKEFESWKKKVEQETTSHYVRERRVYSLGSGHKTISLCCHRSGFYRSKGSGHKKIKKQGSNKINATCPSKMEVFVDNTSGLVKVKFWKTHVGHSSDVRHLPLSEEDRALIADMLMQGMTLDEIMQEVKGSTRGEKLKRLHFLTKQDLRNIKNNVERLNDGATERINQWVQGMKTFGEESPVIYYKARGEYDAEGVLDEKAMLLMIMTTFQRLYVEKFGMNKACLDGDHSKSAFGFELLTLLIVTDAGEACPVAFCVTNQPDENCLIQFFSKVKERCGGFESEVFMCLDCPVHFKAWCAVMNKPQKHLVWTKHVEKNCQQQLSKASIASERRTEILESINAILNEPNHINFEAMLSSVISELSSDEQMFEFSVYFQTHYLNTASSWALCYRHGWDVDAEKQLEKFHKLVESSLEMDAKNKQLDLCINLLLSYSRDEITNILIKASDVLLANFIHDIKLAHRRAKLEALMVELVSENLWEVMSECDDTKYTVTGLNVNCSCKLKCSKCNVCVHMYSCTCADHLLKLTICKHVHACILNQLSEENVDSEVEMDLHLIEDHTYEVNDDSVVNLQKVRRDGLELMQKKVDLLMGLALSGTPQDINMINNHLDTIIDEVKKSKIQNSAAVNSVMPVIISNAAKVSPVKSLLAEGISQLSSGIQQGAKNLNNPVNSTGLVSVFMTASGITSPAQVHVATDAKKATSQSAPVRSSVSSSQTVQGVPQPLFLIMTQ